MLTRRTVLTGLGALPFLKATGTRAEPGVILLGSTTTTENSGLLAHVIPRFEADTGLTVRIVVAGTGKIHRLMAQGDLDVALTHFPEGEADLVARGLAAARVPIMANDFLIVGPDDDPAGVRSAATASDALNRIAAAGATFYSRGDESGTHQKERSLWPAPPLPGPAAPRWYRETGAGMGATLNIVASTGGYTLADRGTWAAFGNRGDLAMLFEGDPALSNPYALLTPVIKDANGDGAARLSTWLTSAKGRAAINGFRVNGEQVFTAAEAAQN